MTLVTFARQTQSVDGIQSTQNSLFDFLRCNQGVGYCFASPGGDLVCNALSGSWVTSTSSCGSYFYH